jgi:hypothetical protein
MATAVKTLSSAGMTVVGTYVKEDIETRIRQECYKKQIRVKEFFVDFDRLRKGWVTDDKVQTIPYIFNP